MTPRRFLISESTVRAALECMPAYGYATPNQRAAICELARCLTTAAAKRKSLELADYADEDMVTLRSVKMPDKVVANGMAYRYITALCAFSGYSREVAKDAVEGTKPFSFQVTAAQARDIMARTIGDGPDRVPASAVLELVRS